MYPSTSKIRPVEQSNSKRTKQTRPVERQVETAVGDVSRNRKSDGGAMVRVRGWHKSKPIEPGFRSGRLAVVQSTELRASDKQIIYECLCDCGKTSFVRGQFIRKRITLSCGCLQSEVTAARSLTHGQNVGYKRTKAYRVWTNMLSRCGNPNVKSFKDYGARGIKVCARWKKFAGFLADMGNPPAGLTLERKNNDGNYEPKNCKWATWKEQASNRRQ